MDGDTFIFNFFDSSRSEIFLLRLGCGDSMAAVGWAGGSLWCGLLAHPPRAGLVTHSSEMGTCAVCWGQEELFQQHRPTLMLPGQLGAGTGPSAALWWAVGSW